LRIRTLLFALLYGIAVAAAIYWWRFHPRPGAYEAIAIQINDRSSLDCDKVASGRRVGLAKVIDRHREEIQGLWAGRKKEEFPHFPMESVGPIFLRLNPPREKRTGFEVTSWSWEEGYALYWRLQQDPNHPDSNQRWRDLDTLVRFLLEKDLARILLGREFRTPDAVQHQFRRTGAVTRTSPQAFAVRLHPGDFSEERDKLRLLLEREWRSHGKEVKVIWDESTPDTYRVQALFRAGRSYVNHRRRSLVIANFSWVRTVAHELGHVLGFDDHYYSVWNERNCYYTQESRLNDLMSNSETGTISPRHWEILNEAYPWRASSDKTNFPYQFGK
jgi:hypothetical protein